MAKILIAILLVVVEKDVMSNSPVRRASGGLIDVPEGRVILKY